MYTNEVFYLIFSAVISVALYFFFKWKRKVWIIEKIPGPKTVPIFGNALELNVDSKEFFRILTQEYSQYGSGLFRVWIGPSCLCFVTRATGVEAVLRSQKYIDKSILYYYLEPWLGTGLLTSTGTKWQSRRKLLTPTFHFKILEDFMVVFNKASSKFVSKLESKVNGEPFDIFKYISLCTLDIILESAMGKEINAQDNADSDYVTSLFKISEIIQKRQTRPWLQPDVLFKLSGYKKEHDECLRILHGFANKTIKDRREEYRASKLQSKPKDEDRVLGQKKRLALLDMLLEYSEENNALTDEDIREEVDTFMFEGQDTTAAAINWSIYLLGSHPEMQKKVCEELDAIFGDSDRETTFSDLREMKYLECCIKEALRIFPSVPIIGREFKEDAVIDGYQIPKGTDVMILTYNLHRDPEHFPEPEVFNPDRFLQENSLNRHPYAYVPFSAGPRNCIGQKFALMEEKIVLSSFFRKYKVESTESRKDLNICGTLVIRPEIGTFIKISHRNEIESQAQ